MPSRTSNKNLRGLPADPEPEGVRCICVPVPNDPDWIGAFFGQLQRLSLQSIWDRDEAHTAEVVARRWLDVYFATLEGNCSGGICEVPPPFEIDIGINIEIVRIGEGGHWEVLIDGVWTTPTGDYEIPPVPEREESTADERRCLAAANAAAALQQTYEDATDAFTSDGTQVAVYEAILATLITRLGAWAAGFAASSVGFYFAAFLLFYELLETITSDVWTTEFNDEFLCILYKSSNDTAGVVTFDWEMIFAELTEMTFQAGADLERQQLIQQIRFMLTMIGVDGINHAGATTFVTSADCDECGDWCYLFDFSVSNGGFTTQGGGFYDTSLTPDRWRAAQNWPGLPNRIGIRAHRTFSARFITRLEIDHELDKLIGGSGDAGTINLLNGGVLVYVSPGTVSDCGGYSRLTDVYFPNVVADEIRFGTDVHTNGQSDGCSGANGQYYCYDILIAGQGSNPIGSDNC